MRHNSFLKIIRDNGPAKCDPSLLIVWDLVVQFLFSREFSDEIVFPMLCCNVVKNTHRDYDGISIPAEKSSEVQRSR